MKTLSLVSRYGKALIRVLGEGSRAVAEVKQMKKDLEVFFQIQAAKAVLANPAMPKALKTELIEYALQHSVANKELQDSVLFLVEKGRYEIVVDVLEHYLSLVDKAQGIVDAQVSAAAPLSREQQRKLMAVLEKLFHKKIRLHTKIDPSLLGGLYIKVEQNTLDLSFSNRIGRLASSFIS